MSIQNYARMANEHSWYMMLEVLGYEYLGSGVYRDVFAIDNNWVIKIAKINDEGSRTEGIMANIAEFDLWGSVMNGEPYRKVRDWLAPIREMTPDGVATIQARTYPARESQLPKTLPRWSTDHKPSNGGMLKGKFVLHDYQWYSSVDDMVKNHRLVKAKW